MYTPLGTPLSEVGDIEVFPDGDDLHLFHLTLPNHDVVQHAVSTDGLSWQALPAAIRTGDPGECDDDQIWTMSVTQRAIDDYVMVYTALARADRGRIQRTAVATSSDLIHWRKGVRNPVASADPRWYEADPAQSGGVSWRDPKPIKIGETYFATVNARERRGPVMRRGCVGLLASSDLERWEVRPPLFAPRGYWDLECPQVFVIGGAFYLTAAIMEDRTQRYWTAPAFDGPYEIPADGGLLAPLGHYAGRVCRWKGLDLFFCWHDPFHETRRRSSAAPKPIAIAPDVDWDSVSNPHGKYVVAPLALDRQPNGRLARRSFPGWNAFHDGPDEHPAPADRLAFSERESHGEWRIEATGGSTDLLVMRHEAEHFVFEGRFSLSSGSGGLVFRFDPRGGGYEVHLQTGSAEIALHKRLPESGRDGRVSSARYVELQRGRVVEPIAAGKVVTFRLVVVGPYIECSIDGEVALATASAERTAGPAGVWAESGNLEAHHLVWRRMRAPEHR